MVEVDGGKAGLEDQQHAGWVAPADLLRGQVVIILTLIIMLILLNTHREASPKKILPILRLGPKSGWVGQA